MEKKVKELSDLLADAKNWGEGTNTIVEDKINELTETFGWFRFTVASLNFLIEISEALNELISKEKN